MATIIFSLLGGLAIFIFGMHFMGEGLQKAAGNKMRRILEILTSVPIIGVMVGTFVTAIIQSSSATTVMVVGFTNAGLMTLKQAVSVIMGANIGTTITAQLIAFKLAHFFLPIIAIGFFLYFVVKKKQLKYLGQILFGFGILLMGLGIMGDAMSPLREYEGFVNFITAFGEYKMLGVLVGIVMTMLIQSSSATIGILMAMSMQGIITIDIALPVLLGDNIGTCVTTLLASIGANLSAKRAAVSHVIFNTVGTIIFLLLMPYFKELVLLISPAGDIARQIANAHTSFNILNTLLFIPLISFLVKIAERLVPGEERIISKKPLYLDDRMLNSPSIAVSLAKREIVRMGHLAYENLNDAVKSFVNKDEKLIRHVLEVEDVIDTMERETVEYLAKINQQGMTENVSNLHSGLLHAVNDVERVGDHANNIVKWTRATIEDKVEFSDEAIISLQEMQKLTANTFRDSIKALDEGDVKLAESVFVNESLIDQMEKKLRESHISRLNKGECFPYAGIIFLDLLGDFERIGDHANNIAEVVTNDMEGA